VIYSVCMGLRNFIGWYGLHDRVMVLLEEQAAEIIRLRQQNDLNHVRNVRDLVNSFLEALEYGVDEEELKADLHAGLQDLNDHLCRLEEHVL
jgi:hypothetical protein